MEKITNLLDQISDSWVFSADTSVTKNSSIQKLVFFHDGLFLATQGMLRCSPTWLATMLSSMPLQRLRWMGRHRCNEDENLAPSFSFILHVFLFAFPNQNKQLYTVSTSSEKKKDTIKQFTYGNSPIFRGRSPYISTKTSRPSTGNNKANDRRGNPPNSDSGRSNEDGFVLHVKDA